ncbi:MAG: peptidoglycan DD-metalloendopeptidase family protein [Anaerolineaceae bacterium]
MFFLVAIILPLIIPFTIALFIAFYKPKTKLEWFIGSWFTLAFALYNLLTGSWFLLSVYLRYVLLAVVAAAIVFSFFRMPRSTPGAAFKTPGYRNLMTLYFVPTLTLTLFVLVVVQGRGYSGGPVSLAFPLKDGTYIISQGGRNSMVNSHRAQSPEAYAIDVVKLNSYGARASEVFPTSLEQTIIYNSPVYSPCDGKISGAVDDLPDLVPGKKVAPVDSTGNYVTITCQGVEVLLSGIKNGSLTVAVGDSVMSGDPLAVVGTSYENTEPHLHIQASSGGTAGQINTGTPVPILFDGRFLARGDTITK